MINPATRLRLRRRLRRRQKQVSNISTHADERFEQHFVRRLSRVWAVRRFVVVWVVLLGLLITVTLGQTWGLSSYYQTVAASVGGTFAEGSVGSFTSANPLFAQGPIDSAISHLLFSSLFTYNDHNQLTPDLAEGFTVDAKGTTYTITLRPHLQWQDGLPLSSADVLFTYQTIQNPDTRSPLLHSWHGITVKALDNRTISFTLPSPLSSFPYAMTNGIVPEHLLAKTPVSQLRSLRFNTDGPVGSGPFRWQAIEVSGNETEQHEQRIALKANNTYYRGRPKLDNFVIQTFNSQQRLLDSFKKGQLSAAAGLERLSKQYQNDRLVQAFNIPLTSATFVFFKTTQGVLKDQTVRQALELAVDQNAVLASLGHPATPAREPFLNHQLGFDPTLTQPAYNPAQANQLLDATGWVKDATGTRVKNGQSLSFVLSSENTSDYAAVSTVLQRAWQAVGAHVEVSLQEADKLQSNLALHNYDGLLYGIALGVDPDVFAYWHSSQADPRSTVRLNLSEYQSKTADVALEAGRTRSAAELRVIKYRPFLQAWRSDVPAIALYQSRFLYLVRGSLRGFEPQAMNGAADRFNNVQNWTILQAKVAK